MPAPAVACPASACRGVALPRLGINRANARLAQPVLLHPLEQRDPTDAQAARRLGSVAADALELARDDAPLEGLDLLAQPAGGRALRLRRLELLLDQAARPQPC